jgi:hypothetical protein
MSLEKPDFPSRKIELPGEKKETAVTGQESPADRPDKQKEEFKRGKELFASLSKTEGQKRFCWIREPRIKEI